MSYPPKPIILALDVPSREEALQWVRRLHTEISVFKVGMQLFYRYGPDIVKQVQDAGGEVFLDLKLHDIPNTVASACQSLRPLEARFLTIHISGGEPMLKAAVEAMQGSPTQLIGITALTSLENEIYQRIHPGSTQPLQAWGVHLTKVAASAGLDGVVCSAQENHLIRQQVGEDMCIINPGIRPAGAAVQDQKRVLTPQEAIHTGANYLVMGRPILQAPNPVETVRSIMEEIHDAVGLSS